MNKVFGMYWEQWKNSKDFTTKVNLSRLMEIQLGESEIGYTPKNEPFDRKKVK